MRNKTDILIDKCVRRTSMRYLARAMRDGPDFDDHDIVEDVCQTAAMAFEDQPKYAKRAVSELYRKFARQSATETMSAVRAKLLEEVLRNPKARLSDVRESLARLGIVEDAETGDSVVRTLISTQRTIGQNAQIWLATINDPDVWGYEYRTAEDERVRKSHAAMDGIRYAKRHAFWRRYAPPNGWNCRCQLVPIYVGSRRARTSGWRGWRLGRRPDVDAEFLWNPGRVLAG